MSSRDEDAVLARHPFFIQLPRHDNSNNKNDGLMQAGSSVSYKAKHLGSNRFLISNLSFNEVLSANATLLLLV